MNTITKAGSKKAKKCRTPPQFCICDQMKTVQINKTQMQEHNYKSREQKSKKNAVILSSFTCVTK